MLIRRQIYKKNAWSWDFDFNILTTTCATLLNSKVSLKMESNSYNTSDEIAIQQPSNIQIVCLR